LSERDDFGSGKGGRKGKVRGKEKGISSNAIPKKSRFFPDQSNGFARETERL
jgi:hypothetical protein